MYIENINSPKDLKALSVEQLNVVADEVRAGVLNRVSNHGGHVGPNLGIVEATVALHYVFNAPVDRFVFDVSHQSYPHKILTGRKDGFLNVEDMNAVSGFSSPLESPEYDNFEIGHTSTSISLASGLMKGRDILGGKENVIAVIGDGSLSGGEAFEGLDTVAEIGTNMIIVVNDNEMSIANNPTGGLYKNLAQLRETKGEAEHNYFKSLGFEYMYVEEGNDVVKLVEAFLKVKDIDHPVVVHIHTEKGHGFKPAVENKEMWHFGMPFNLEDGSSKMTGEMPETYDDILNNWLWENMQKDPKMVIVTAGTPACMGFFADKREKAGKQFIDCGIAEEQAVAIASGIAKRGGRPVFTDYATFFQRTYDQLAQDLAVNGNSAVMNVTWASISAMNDFTHIGFFDIPMISHIPNLHYMAPTTAEELVAMEKWAVEQDKYSIAIRVPFGVAVHSDKKYDTDYSDLINKAEMLKAGEQVAIIGVGNYLQKAESVSKLLEAKGINATVINPRWVSGSDEEMLEDLKKNHRLVVTLEDGCLDGGYGERISRFYSASDMKVLNFGVKKQLYDRYDVNELMKENHLTDEQIVEDILSVK